MHDDLEFISMGEAARALKVSKPRISQLLAAGKLDGMLQNGRRMIACASIERYRQHAHGGSSASSAQRFTLMSANHEIAQVAFESTREHPLSVLEIIDPARMPFGTVTSSDTLRRKRLNDWWSHRSVPSTRPGLVAKLSKLGMVDVSGLPVRNLGLSLSDCYWLRPCDGEELAWDAINYFDNNFDDAVSEHWDEWLGAVGLDSPDNTSEGELPKRWAIRGDERVLIKGCTLDDQRPYNEVVATALHRRLLQESDYVPYEVTRVRDEPACLCADFLRAKEEYVPAVYVKECLGNTRGTSLYDRFAKYAGRWTGNEEEVRVALSKMIVCDAIIANTDRHWRNFGFIRSVENLGMRPAPLFDSGNSLWYTTSFERLERGDWSFATRPFDVNPERQLALADRLDWFDPSALDGFVDEAIELLGQSRSVMRDGKLDGIARALAERVSVVTTVVGTLRHVHR